MAVDAALVRQQFTAAAQLLAADIVALCAKYDKLNALYNGAGLSGTFIDGELAAIPSMKHMDAAFVGTLMNNFITIRAAIVAGIQQNCAKAVGDLVKY